MSESSVILTDETLDSESIRPEQSEELAELTFTVEEESLQGQTTTLAEACELARRKLYIQFRNRFLQLINEADFEFGFSTPADEYVRRSLENYGTFAREWINELYVDSFDNPFVMSAILRVISHFEYRQMYPQGMTMAAAAIAAEKAGCVTSYAEQ